MKVETKGKKDCPNFDLRVQRLINCLSIPNIEINLGNAFDRQGRFILSLTITSISRDKQ